MDMPYQLLLIFSYSKNSKPIIIILHHDHHLLYHLSEASTSHQSQQVTPVRFFSHSLSVLRISDNCTVVAGTSRMENQQISRAPRRLTCDGWDRRESEK